MNPRLVGDPIDVVTGANIDQAGDLFLAGPFPLDFTRYYNSGENTRRRALGWGHAHELERYLIFDLDGIEYRMPDGGTVQFPMIQVGQSSAGGGWTLKRTGKNTYWLSNAECSMQFRSTTSTRALLCRLGNDPHFIELEHDRQNRVERVIDSLGRELCFKYEPEFGLKSVIWKNGKLGSDWCLLEYAYDQAGNLSKGVDAYGNTFEFQFDAFNRMTRKTDRRGHSFLYRYDQLGRCIASHASDGLHEVNLEYLPDQTCTQVTRGDGGTWLYFYSELGAITQVIDPGGGKIEYTIDEAGRITKETDPGGTAWTWIYSDDGTPLGKQNELGQFVDPDEGGAPIDPFETAVPANPAQWEFGEVVPLSSRDDELGHDDFILGQRPAQLDRMGTVKNVNGLLETEDGRTFDHFGNLVKHRFSDGSGRRWSYDANGCVTKYVDRDGSKYTFEYDSWNIQTAAVDPLGHRSSVAVNQERFITKVVDEGGHAHAFAYDARDRLVEVRRFDRIKESYEHDLAGNLTKKIDGNGRVLFQKTHGPNNQVEQTTTGDGKTFAYSYDADGRVASIESAGCQLEFKHDGWGHRTTDLRNELGVVHRFEDHSVVHSTVLNHFSVRYQFHPDGSRSVIDPTGKTHSFVAGKNGVIKRLANHSSEELNYDSHGRLLQRNVSTKTESRTTTYQYSGEGYLQQLVDSRDGTTDVVCDPSHRLQSITNGSVAEYCYDRANNLLKKPGLTDVVIGHGNQIQTANGERFEFNDRNAISRRQSLERDEQYVYDAEDQLVSVTSGQRKWEAEYDATGRRIRTTSWRGTNRFYWDDNRLAAEIRDDQSIRVYVYADHLAITPFMFVDYAGIDSDPANGQCFYLRNNQLGAPVEVEDSEGLIVWNATYDAYGQVQVGQANIEFNLRMPGHYHDRETGLHYNRFRYYDARLGRYIQPDPIGLGGGKNLYAYCHNPLVEIDLRGLARRPCGGSKSKGSEETAASKKRRHPHGDGITRRHLDNIRKHAKSVQRYLIFREPNPGSKKFHNDPNFRPKPAGLPTGYVKDAFDDDGNPLRSCSTDDNGVVKWRDKSKSPPEPFDVDADGNLLLRDQDGRPQKMFSDYDLENVHNRDGTEINYNTDNNRGRKNVAELNKAIHDDKLGRIPKDDRMAQHGPNGQYLDDDGKPKLPPKDDERYTAVTPDGDVHRFDNPEQLKQFYEENGLRWPYD